MTKRTLGEVRTLPLASRTKEILQKAERLAAVVAAGLSEIEISEARRLRAYGIDARTAAAEVTTYSRRIRFTVAARLAGVGQPERAGGQEGA